MFVFDYLKKIKNFLFINTNEQQSIGRTIMNVQFDPDKVDFLADIISEA
uniref:Uncharacterized protein n=1 Tax=Megaviridae environmental sample TaxID=1737588 RepID=A0A5J6VJW5_9VIRU|nr:MAG: hypothetical protein [Megaviridae environmental sample]